MESNRSLFNAIKTENYKIDIILKNVITMLSNRIYIDKQGEKQILLNKDYSSDLIDKQANNTFIIKANNGDNYVIKIIFHKISAVGKKSDISEFMTEYEKYKKIIIATDFNNKMQDFVIRNKSQIFKESELLSDMISYVYNPKFIVLSPKETEEFKNAYNATDYTIIKISKNDPVSRYFALKKGDVIKVIRPSPTSGYSIAYRIVT